MTTDWKALCAELLAWAEKTSSHYYKQPDVLLRARAALAEQPVWEGPPAVTTGAWLHPAYEPGDGSADGAQMVELAWWHPQFGCDSLQMVVDNARAVLARWGNPAPQPVPVSERLPEPNTKVLAYYFNSHGNGRTICAIWVPAKSRSYEDDLDASVFSEHDEDVNKDYWPEGWYEQIENSEDLGWVNAYEGEVAYWQPLPKWPAHALPLPEQEVSK